MAKENTKKGTVTINGLDVTENVNRAVAENVADTSEEQIKAGLAVDKAIADARIAQEKDRTDSVEAPVAPEVNPEPAPKKPAKRSR